MYLKDFYYISSSLSSWFLSPHREGFCYLCKFSAPNVDDSTPDVTIKTTALGIPDPTLVNNVAPLSSSAHVVGTPTSTERVSPSVSSFVPSPPKPPRRPVFKGKKVIITKVGRRKLPPSFLLFQLMGCHSICRIMSKNGSMWSNDALQIR